MKAEPKTLPKPYVAGHRKKLERHFSSEQLVSKNYRCPADVESGYRYSSPLNAVTFSIERLTDIAALERLSGEWDLLDAQLSPRTPFTSPLWNLLWWKYFREDRSFVRDELYAHAVRDENGALVAVAPMMLTMRPTFAPMRTRELHFFGADPNLTEMRGLVCRPQDQSKVLAALRSHFESKADDWDWIEWRGVRSSGDSGELSADKDHIQWSADVEDYYLPLPETWEKLKAGLTRNIKESLRKCYNSLKRDLHSFVFCVVETPTETDAALARFFILHAARADDDTSVKHPDVFKSRRARAFFTEYCQKLAKRGQLRIFQIEIGGAVVATRVGFVFGTELYLFYSGYDSTWGRYSIMTTVLAETIKWAIENRFTIANLSTGNDVSKMRWHPVEVGFKCGVQRSSKPQRQWAFKTYQKLVRHSGPGTMLGLVVASMRRRNR